MQVLNTTSPSLSATSAPNSHPSNTAPDSSASLPATCSATGGLRQLRRPGQQVFVVVDDDAIADGQHHTAAEPGAVQRSVVREREARGLPNRPLSGRVEQHAGR